MDGERKKNSTQSTLSTTEEPNSSQHHDDIPPTRSPASTTSPAAAKERLTAKTRCFWPSSVQQDEVIRSKPRCTWICGLWHKRYATYQDKWLYDSLPACKASGEFVSFIPDFASACELCSNRVEFVTSFFLQLVYPAQVSTHCRLAMSLVILLSQQRSEQIKQQWKVVKFAEFRFLPFDFTSSEKAVVQSSEQ